MVIRSDVLLPANLLHFCLAISTCVYPYHLMRLNPLERRVDLWHQRAHLVNMIRYGFDNHDADRVSLQVLLMSDAPVVCEQYIKLVLCEIEQFPIANPVSPFSASRHPMKIVIKIAQDTPIGVCVK